MRTIGGSSSTLNTGLTAYWKLDESSDGSAPVTRVDSGSNGQDLTDNNTTASTTGIISNAGQFVWSSNEYLSRADSTTLSTGNIDFTLSVWIYTDDITGTKAILSKDATGQREYDLLLVNASLTFYVFSSAGANKSAGPHTLSASTWYHIVAWHDATADTVNMRINDTTLYSTPTAALVVNDSTASFNVGNRELSASYMNGRIDEVGFWKRVLTASEITELYNSGAGKTCCPF